MLIRTFSYKTKPLRIGKREQETWFLVKDLVQIIGRSIHLESKNIPQDGKSEYWITTQQVYKLLENAETSNDVFFKNWLFNKTIPVLETETVPTPKPKPEKSKPKLLSKEQIESLLLLINEAGNEQNSNIKQRKEVVLQHYAGSLNIQLDVTL